MRKHYDTKFAEVGGYEVITISFEYEPDTEEYSEFWDKVKLDTPGVDYEVTRLGCKIIQFKKVKIEDQQQSHQRKGRK